MHVGIYYNHIPDGSDKEDHWENGYKTVELSDRLRGEALRLAVLDCLQSGFTLERYKIIEPKQ